MKDFKAKMHQIRFRLGLRPRPRWRSLQRSPELDLGAASRQGRGWAGEEEGKEEGRGVRGKWSGGKGKAPKLLLNQGPSEIYATASIVYHLTIMSLVISLQKWHQHTIN